MRRIAAFAALAFFMLALVPVRADAPEVSPGVLILDGGRPLEVGLMSKPAVVDWNNDGKKDLILGEREGYLRIYLNTGADADPVFSGFDYLQLDGSAYDVGYNSSPYIVDWNEDGKKDVLVGDDSGHVALLLNTGTDADPVFTAVEQLQDGAAPLLVGTESSPVAWDWNRDGAKDLLVGETEGRVFFYENQGTDAAPVFNGHTLLGSGEMQLDVGYYSRFDVVDWDDDGIDDVISGQYNPGGSPQAGVLFFRSLFTPRPDAKVNGLDGPISVPQAQPLVFTIGLDPRSLDGDDADWWVRIAKSSGQTWWCQYNGGTKKWTKSSAPIRFAGVSLRTVNSYKVLGPRTIPAGEYTFTFAVDAKDGVYQGTYSDSVAVTVY